MGRFHGDLPERTYQFALAVCNVVRGFPSGTFGWVIGRQLLKSGTSVGANTEEADCALTEREFAQFCNIARREAAESRYWIRLCAENNLINPESAANLRAEADELVRILSTIVHKTSNRPPP